MVEYMELFGDYGQYLGFIEYEVTYYNPVDWIPA